MSLTLDPELRHFVLPQHGQTLSHREWPRGRTFLAGEDRMVRIIFFIIALLFPGHASGSELKRVHLSKAMDLAVPFLDVEGLTIREDGTVIVSDRLAYRLFVVEKDRQRITSTGHRGKRDGEFLGPGPVSACHHRIAVADFLSRRIQVFTDSLKHVRTLYAPGPIFDLHFDDSGKLWVASHGERITGTLYCFDSTGNIIRTIVPRHSCGDLFLDVFIFTMLPRGRLCLAYMAQKAVEVYDTAGVLLSQPSLLSLPGSPESESIPVGNRGALLVPKDVIFRAIGSDPQGRVHLLSGGYADRPHQDVYVLSESGNIADCYTLPEPAQGLWFDRSGHLFVSCKNKSTVKFYDYKFDR